MDEQTRKVKGIALKGATRDGVACMTSRTGFTGECVAVQSKVPGSSIGPSRRKGALVVLAGMILDDDRQ